MDPGTVFAGCRIEREAGRGGMGVVYCATQLALERRVALKLLAPELANDAGFRARFQQESRLAAQIDHPNVVDVYEAGEEDGRLFIEMRWVEGSDLRRVIEERGRLAPERAVEVVAQVADALDAAHALGLVHRDVKPANILLGQRHGRERAYLTDFGLTKRVASQGGPTQTGQWVGTLDYVAPEQIRGDMVDARTDVYALGGVLLHALTGSVPFQRDSDVAKMWGHINDPPQAPTSVVPSLPRELDDVVLRALAKDPADRYPSAGDLGRAALAAVVGRAPAEPERMVARGEASPQGAEPEPTMQEKPSGPDTDPAQTDPQPRQPLPPPPPPPPAAAVPPPGAAATPVPGPAVPPPQRGAGGRRGLVAIVAVLGVVLLLGLAAGVLAAAGVFSSSETTTTQATLPPVTSTTATTGGRVDTIDNTARVSGADVRSVLDRYAAAYTAHDRASLRALFAPGFTRKNNNEPTKGIGGAMADYAKQFSQFPDARYNLNVLDIKPEDGGASVSATYTIDNAGPTPSTGSIGFHLSNAGGALKIDAIAIQTG